MANKIKFAVPLRGGARAIYSPDAAKVLSSLGPTVTRRASHVEPTLELREQAILWLGKATDQHGLRRFFPALPADFFDQPFSHPSTLIELRRTLDEMLPGVWWADMTPVAPLVLGPFNTNTEALAAEVAWLEQHHYPVSETPTHAHD